MMQLRCLWVSRSLPLFLQRKLRLLLLLSSRVPCNEKEERIFEILQLGEQNRRGMQKASDEPVRIHPRNLLFNRSHLLYYDATLDPITARICH